MNEFCLWTTDKRSWIKFIIISTSHYQWNLSFVIELSKRVCVTMHVHCKTMGYITEKSNNMPILWCHVSAVKPCRVNKTNEHTMPVREEWHWFDLFWILCKMAVIWLLLCYMTFLLWQNRIFLIIRLHLLDIYHLESC